MKKYVMSFIALVTVVAVWAGSEQAAANKVQDVRVVVDGKVVKFDQQPVISDGRTLVPIRRVAEALGALVWWNAESALVGINREDTRIAFIVGARTARVNEESFPMPESQIINGRTMVPLRFISETLGEEVEWDGPSNTIFVGGTKEILLVQQAQMLSQSATHLIHTIERGDTSWNLSVKYGIPHLELMNVNQLKESSVLWPGDHLVIPVHNVPVKKMVTPNHGELLDWWTEAQYVFTIGKVAKITDFRTKKTFFVKRTTGASHADSEPLTAQDARIMREIWGGNFSWTPRAVIVEVDGRKLAASMHSFPHGVKYINNNNYNGHFCIHFLNSRFHFEDRASASHQQQVRIAAGAN